MSARWSGVHRSPGGQSVISGGVQWRSNRVWDGRGTLKNASPRSWCVPLSPGRRCRRLSPQGWSDRSREYTGKQGSWSLAHRGSPAPQEPLEPWSLWTWTPLRAFPSLRTCGGHLSCVYLGRPDSHVWSVSETHWVPMASVTRSCYCESFVAHEAFHICFWKCWKTEGYK